MDQQQQTESKDEQLQGELAAVDFKDSGDAEATFQQFTDEELEHFVALSCERQKAAEYDLKQMATSYKEIINLEKERRDLLLGHLKTRREASAQAQNLVQAGAVQAQDLANQGATVVAIAGRK